MKFRLYLLVLAVSVGVCPGGSGRVVYVFFNRRNFVKPGASWFEFSFCRLIAGRCHVRRLLLLRYAYPSLKHTEPGRLIQFEQFEQSKKAYAKHRPPAGA